MSNQQIRQSELFSGEDWKVLYRAFTQINFNAYDPVTVNASLRDYIQQNYPEQFNDWTENSEFVAIIDLLSWLAGSLAFRTDINARENFLETAESRESVLRLARFLSYNAKRAQASRGLVKVVDVKTTQSISDSFGINLNNKVVRWNDPDNPDWMEQFTLILNSAFPVTNPFGIPLKTGTISSITTQLYEFTNTSTTMGVYKFDASVNGQSDTFEVVNMDIEDGVGFSERAPNPATAMHIAYRNDGLGNGSARTGFFLMFKQGTLAQQTFSLTNPVENRTIDIDATNVSETDVWAQTINDDGSIQTYWTKVPAVFTDNITFNNITPDVRTIFSVVTRDSDRITLRFGDGTFGNVPVGNLRVWYRTVNGQQYQLRPTDLNDVTITMPYMDVAGRTQTLTLTVALQENINNASASEDIELIRRRAPQVFGTQNRMVSGEDYNQFPLSSSDITKLRSVNRVYSGHSRYVDINDPTSTYQDTVVYSDDGVVFAEDDTQYLQVSAATNISTEQLLVTKIQPMLEDLAIRDYFVDLMARQAGTKFYMLPDNLMDLADYVAKWTPTVTNAYSATGTLVLNSDPRHINPEDTEGAFPGLADNLEKFMGVEAMLKFRWVDFGDNNKEKFLWVKVLSCTATYVQIDQFTTTAGWSLVLNNVLPDEAELVGILPAFRADLSARLVDTNTTTEYQDVEEYLSTHRPFKLWYDYDQVGQLQFDGGILHGRWIAQDINVTTPPTTTSVGVMTVKFINGLYWTIETLVGLRYVFQSMENVQWYNDSNSKVIDGFTGLSKKDQITFMDPSLSEVELDIVSNVHEADGHPDPNQIIVTPSDTNDDGSVDNPETFLELVPTGSVVYCKVDLSSLDSNLTPVDMLVYSQKPSRGRDGLVDGSVYFLTTTQKFYNYAVNGNDTEITDGSYVVRPGRYDLKFEWKHFAGMDIRIDPAVTNVIDVFALTTEYDYQVRQWIAAGADVADMPTPPTDIELSNQFSDLSQYKMFSDQIVWRPVTYKYLFGAAAIPELRAQIKVIKVPNSPLSDGEIKTKIIATINDYFDVNKWEFGETFYFTELAAYIHVQLASSVGSVTIVPQASDSKFGQLFEIRSNSNELFISTAQVSDIVIIDSNTATNLRIS